MKLQKRQFLQEYIFSPLFKKKKKCYLQLESNNFLFPNINFSSRKIFQNMSSFPLIVWAAAACVEEQIKNYSENFNNCWMVEKLQFETCKSAKEGEGGREMGHRNTTIVHEAQKKLY